MSLMKNDVDDKQVVEARTNTIAVISRCPTWKLLQTVGKEKYVTDFDFNTVLDLSSWCLTCYNIAMNDDLVV